MIDPKQAEEVGRIYNRIEYLFMVTHLAVVYGSAMIVGCLSFLVLGLGYDVYSYILVGVIVFLVIGMMHNVLSKPMFRVTAYSRYETDKSLVDCWEETKSMDGYAVRNFGVVEVVDRKDDELSFEVTSPQSLGQVRKKTVRCKRSEDRYLESMRIDLFVGDTLSGQDRVGLRRLNNKTIIEFETTYMFKQTPLEHIRYKLVGHYSPQIAEALGYRKLKSQRNITFR